MHVAAPQFSGWFHVSERENDQRPNNQTLEPVYVRPLLSTVKMLCAPSSFDAKETIYDKDPTYDSMTFWVPDDWDNRIRDAFDSKDMQVRHYFAEEKSDLDEQIKHLNLEA